MRFAAVILAAALLAAATPAYAILPDEFDVYTDDMVKRGETRLELHINTTPNGVRTPSYPGEIVAHHGWRLTPELTYGLNDAWAVGMYIPTVWANGVYYAPGLRLKLEWMPVRSTDNPHGLFFGLNLEASKIARQFEPTDYLDVMAIAGVRGTDWLFSLNPTFTWSMNQMQQTPTGSLGAKLMRKVSESWEAGAEYYSGFGTVSSTLPFNQQSNNLFAAVDYTGRAYDVNFGIGRGVTSASDKWTIKAILEFPL